MTTTTTTTLKMKIREAFIALRSKGKVKIIPLNTINLFTLHTLKNRIKFLL